MSLRPLLGTVSARREDARAPDAARSSALPAADWRPSATLARLRQRACLLARIREFFARRSVLEVETPLLAPSAASEPQLHSLAVEEPMPGSGRHYLQTSPEAAMKRLLAVGSGAIYQLGRAFRGGEHGAWHNPEFTMLEWYRPGWDERRLAREALSLIAALAGVRHSATRDYRVLFQRRTGLDAHRAGLSELQEAAGVAEPSMGAESDRGALLDFLFATRVAPLLSRCRGTVLVHSFPAVQAAQAALGEEADGTPVARRFEIYLCGVELVNGYAELRDAAEQRRRFDADLAVRRRIGLPTPPPSERQLAALAAGLPPVAGAAMGVDRLVALALGERAIAPVMAFGLERA